MRGTFASQASGGSRRSCHRFSASRWRRIPVVIDEAAACLIGNGACYVVSTEVAVRRMGESLDLDVTLGSDGIHRLFVSRSQVTLLKRRARKLQVRFVDSHIGIEHNLLAARVRKAFFADPGEESSFIEIRGQVSSADSMSGTRIFLGRPKDSDVSGGYMEIPPWLAERLGLEKGDPIVFRIASARVSEGIDRLRKREEEILVEGRSK
jgi:hypothetical protein